MKKSILAGLGLATFLLTSAPALRAADKACSVASLKGGFGYTVTGQAPNGASFAAVGRLLFDGQGNVSTVRTLSNGGVIVRNDQGSGTYTMGADCRGTFTIGAVGLGQLLVDVVLAGENNEIRGIVTNSGFVLTLVGTKQGKD